MGLTIVGVLVVVTGISLVGRAGELLYMLSSFPELVALFGLSYYLAVGLYIGIGVALVGAGLGLLMKKSWSFWLGLTMLVAAIVYVWPSAMAEISCLSVGRRYCIPGWFYYIPILVEALAATSLIFLIAAFRQFRGKTASVD